MNTSSDSQPAGVQEDEKWKDFFSRPSRKVPAPPPSTLIIDPTQQRPSLDRTITSGSDVTTPDASKSSPELQQNKSIDETPTSAEFRFFDNDDVKPLTPEVRPVMPLLDASQIAGTPRDDALGSLPERGRGPSAAKSAWRHSQINSDTAVASSPRGRTASAESIDYSQRMHENASAVPTTVVNPIVEKEKKVRKSNRRASSTVKSDGLFKMRDDGSNVPAQTSKSPSGAGNQESPTAPSTQPLSTTSSAAPAPQLVPHLNPQPTTQNRRHSWLVNDQESPSASPTTTSPSPEPAPVRQSQANPQPTTQNRKNSWLVNDQESPSATSSTTSRSPEPAHVPQSQSNPQPTTLNKKNSWLVNDASES